MNESPKINLKLTEKERNIEIFTWFLIFAFWIFTISQYNSLPDTIPTHYNYAGAADAFGKKWMIFTLPLIATILFAGLSILNKFSEIFNYPYAPKQPHIDYLNK